MTWNTSSWQIIKDTRNQEGGICAFSQQCPCLKSALFSQTTLHLNWNYILSMESNFSHTQINSQRHTLIHTSVSGPFKQQKIKKAPMKKIYQSRGLWKAAACFVFHQSALDQRAQSVLEFWDANTKGRRDGMKEERKVGRKKEGKIWAYKEQVDKKVSSGLGLVILEYCEHTQDYCLHRLKGQNFAIYFETAFGAVLLDVGCLVSTKEKKKGLFHCSCFLFVSISKWLNQEKHRSFHNSTSKVSNTWAALI